MEVYEIVNKILVQQKISKREFASKLILLEPKSNRTGEIISEKIIYSYLSGTTTIKSYLIPYISDVLGVPEQFLFEENKKVRMKMIKHLLIDLSDEERYYLQSALNNDKNVEMQNDILELIKYAPEPMLTKIKTLLQKMKDITKEI